MSIASSDFDYIRKLVMDRSAIVLETGKEYLVESRMMPLLHSEELGSIEELVQKLRINNRNGLSDKVVDALTTNETSFFRAIKPFDALKKIVLPDLIEKRKDKKELNIWCGASSSGQEPYTIAMIIRENFPQLANWKIQFIASDISTEMLDRCRRGAYSQLEVNRGLPAMLMVKYFQRDGMEWILKEDIRKMIQFKQINLSMPLPYMPPLDFIFLRNVLIYFDVETKKQVFSQIKKYLKKDGYLFLGAAETTLNLDTSFERINAPQSGCYRLQD